MRRLRLTRERQERFLKALAETGIVSAAVEIAGTSRTRVYELRKRNPALQRDGRRPKKGPPMRSRPRPGGAPLTVSRSHS